MADLATLTSFGRLIHNPGRLAILAILAGCESAEFSFLLESTQQNRGSLSKNLTALAEAGYIEITKRFRGRVPNTSVQMTPSGRRAFRRYRRQYRKLMDRLDREDSRS